ncbi:MAG TPA: hypothetical protein VGY48_06880 [Vicinamibacterales bacterium]|jgi:hypothetical protein|nr:hypothetical protein [Vicinamibacterales bacterium]
MAIDAGSLTARKSLSLITFIIMDGTRWIFGVASVTKSPAIERAVREDDFEQSPLFGWILAFVEKFGLFCEF